MTTVETKQGTEVEAKRVIRNPFNGETFIFSKGDFGGDECRFAVVLESGGTGGGNALVHFHPLASETFTVKSGRLAVVMRGIKQFVEVGQSVTVPAGTPHHFRNADTGQTAVVVEFAPAQHQLRFFQNFATLAEGRPEWFSAKGDLHLLLIALVLHTYRDHLYLAGIPVIVQKFLFKVLAQIARLQGYRSAIEPQEAVGQL